MPTFVCWQIIPKTHNFKKLTDQKSYLLKDWADFENSVFTFRNFFVLDQWSFYENGKTNSKFILVIKLLCLWSFSKMVFCSPLHSTFAAKLSPCTVHKYPTQTLIHKRNLKKPTRIFEGHWACHVTKDSESGSLIGRPASSWWKELFSWYVTWQALYPVRILTQILGK